MKEVRIFKIFLGIFIILSLLSVTISGAAEQESTNLFDYVTTLQSPTPSQGGVFGGDMALSGNWLLVGETGAQVGNTSGAGRAYLFDTDWNLIANFTQNTPLTGAMFSRSVDIKGDILVVGSPRADVENFPEAGEVQVYDTSGTLLYTLQSTQPMPKTKFGREVAIGNGVILMGHCPANAFKGTIAVFDLEQNYLTTLTGESTLSIAGEELAANDEFILIGGTTIYGSVYVFDYDWNHVITLQPLENDAKTGYGGCISISGNHFVVGEPGATVNEYDDAGRAYVYDTDWSLLTTLESPSPEADAEFGIDVSIAGDLVVVGEGKGDVTNGDEGKVYVFDLDGNLLDTIVSPEPTTGAEFGYSVLTNGELLIISEIGATVNGTSTAGKVHVFRTSGAYQPPLMAVFELSNLVIEPESVDAGKDVTISVDVENVGTASGTNPVKLMINGDLAEEESVTVEAGLSEKITFTYQTDVEGTYNVKIGDLEGSFTVTKPLPGFPLMVIVLGLILVAIIITKRNQ